MTLEDTLMKFFSQGNQSTEFPNNLKDLHQSLKRWFLSNVTTLNGNKLVLNPIIDTALIQLQVLLSSPNASTTSVVQAWRKYFTSFLLYATFLPTNPPVGLILPHIGILKVITVIPFSGDIQILSDVSKISIFSSMIKAWVMSNLTTEFWTMMTSTGPIPAPPATFPLRVLA